MTGRIKARLYVSSDCPDTDFTVKLTDVYPDGRSMLVTDGILRARFRESPGKFDKEKPMEPGKIVEIQVDGAAEAQIRGSSGVLINQSGQPAVWRRFECTSAMPANPANFRYIATGGRGQQALQRDPGNTGVAIIRVNDPAGVRQTTDRHWTWTTTKLV